MISGNSYLPLILTNSCFALKSRCICDNLIVLLILFDNTTNYSLVDRNGATGIRHAISISTEWANNNALSSMDLLLLIHECHHALVVKSIEKQQVLIP
uniref:Secreted protein n=1 Tax=Heterorhabditis bacteriophora TaxID=37862 RepID=A0A1I7XLT6_HETBA